MIVLLPPPLSAPLQRAFPAPRDDAEAKAERKMLRRMDIAEAVRK